MKAEGKFARGALVKYTGPNGATFTAVVEMGRVDPARGTVAVRRDCDRRLVWAYPERLEAL